MAVIVVLIVAGSGAASAVASAVTGLLVTLAIVLGSVMFLAVAGGSPGLYGGRARIAQGWGKMITGIR